tara:strand:+ start:427 stop:798 length:372 start_codon:yes stop_codon:yes gene_type:complete
MKDTTTTYDASSINMRKGYDIPHDAFIINAMMECSEDEVAMAMYLVKADDDPLTTKNMADISVLCSILPFLKEHGIREIHRIIDMPFAMFQRWNQSMNKAIEKGLIPDKDSISESDFEDMMNG